ncbi:MAG: hypothetical protein R6X08_10040 [Desulfosalsimonadaceae bacterium]
MTENNVAVFSPALYKAAAMLSAILVCLVLMPGLISISGAAETRNTLARAERLYEESTMDSLKQSVELYSQIAEKMPESYQAAWKGARSSRRITRMAVIRELEDLQEICAAYGKMGMDMAQKAIDLNPEAVEGHFYYAVNVGGYAKGASIWAIIKEGLKDKAQKHLKKAYEIDKTYNEFVLVMHMGLYYEVLPWFAGRDNEKALEHYREALSLMPGDATFRPQLHVLAGKLMLEQGVEEGRALRLLRETAEGGSDYFSGRARKILAEYGKALPKTADIHGPARGSLSFPD